MVGADDDGAWGIEMRLRQRQRCDRGTEFIAADVWLQLRQMWR